VRHRDGVGRLPRTVEDQADLVGAAEIEVVADQRLEEHAARVRAVEHLGQRELGLQDRELIAVAATAVSRGERMRQPRQPAAKERIDLRRGETVADPLQPLGLLARKEPVVQRGERDPRRLGLGVAPSGGR
jgi:hypothetical protein